MGTNITYGWLLAGVVDEGPADQADLQGGTRQVSIGGTVTTLGGHIIIANNSQPILNGDDLMSYLASETLPGEIIQVAVLRNNETLSFPVQLGTRSSPPG